MAEESVDLPVIPRATMSRGVELRRNSSLRASFGNEKEKVVSQYLRASTGSCHDICKLEGRKHVVEAKEARLSIPKRAERKPFRHSAENISMTSVCKFRASADSEPAKIPIIRRRQSVDSVLQISVAKSSESQKQIGNEIGVNKNKTPFVRVNSPSLLRNSHASSIHRRQSSLPGFMVETPPTPTSKRVEPPLKSNSERVKTLQKSASQISKTSSKPTSKTAKSSSKLQLSKDNEMVSEKSVTSLNRDSIAKKTVSSMNSPRISGGQRNSEIKMEKKKASCKASPLKSIARIGARVQRSLKIVSHPKNQPKPRKAELEEHNNEAQEKTLYVIKVESEKQILQSDQNESQDVELSSSISKLPSQEDQEESESATSEYVETLEVEENGKPQKDEIVPDFRENLVEAMTEKSGLMKLKFRRGIVLVGNATDIDADADNTDVVTEKIVLRHQDVQDKKDGSVLFNNVIEETASKLVDAQQVNSKVKALVGAFESVISLQDKKSVANSVN